MPIVYIATNIINGHRYIGVTRRTIEYRRYQHFFVARKGGGFIFAKAIRKYGEGAFKFDILDVVDDYDAALRLECQRIEELKPEYNVAAGGRGAKDVKWTTERRTKALAGMRASWTEERRKTASQKFSGIKPSAATIKAAVAATIASSKSVTCLDDGRFFRSARAAADHYRIRLKSIWVVLGGEQITTRGLHFIYSYRPMTKDECHLAIKTLDNDRRIKSEERTRAARRRPVICSTDKTQHESGAAAARHYGISQTRIMQLCQSGGQTLTGLGFKYSDAA